MRQERKATPGRATSRRLVFFPENLRLGSGTGSGTGSATIGALAPPSYILRALLVQLGLGVLPDASATPWQCHTVAEPLAPDQVITVYDTSSVDHGRIMFDGNHVEDRGCQIRVRSGRYFGPPSQSDSGYRRARQIAVYLDTQVGGQQNGFGTRVTVPEDGVVYLVQSVNRTSDVTYIGEDVPESKRKVYTINVTLTVILLSQDTNQPG